MRILTLNLPPLHKGQHEIRDNLARFNCLVAGRRWGKTRLGTLLCIAKAAEQKHCWWVGPNYPTASVGWRMLRQLAMQIPGAEIRLVDKTINLPTGGWVQVRSADAPESLRGEGLDFVVIDEVAHIAKFGEAWEQALRPALSDRQGGALFISTPKGYNHFYELWCTAEHMKQWARWQMPSWANPFLAAEEIEAAKRDLPALVFRQEYGAEFVQLAGALFKREFFNVIDAAPDARYVRSWDLAISTKTSGDYTVGAKVALHDGRLVIADIVRGRWEWPDAVRMIAQTARADNGTTQGIECVGTQAGMLQMLQREPGLAAVAFRPIQVHADKLTRCMPWLARAEQGRVDLVRGAWNAAFLDEVCAFPETTHDDQVDAVSGAMQMIGGPPATQLVAFV